MRNSFIRRLAATLLVCLLAVCALGAAEGLRANVSSMPMKGAGFNVPFAAAIMGLTTDKLSTRSGPSTSYQDTGTYRVKGEYVRLFGYAYDRGGVCWVQCEVEYGGRLRRLYTGLKRFDTTTFDFSRLPEELPLGDSVKVIATAKAMYGPGDGYGAYGQLTVDKGQRVTVITIENDYAQVEWTTAKQSYRAWVPVDTLEYWAWSNAVG